MSSDNSHDDIPEQIEIGPDDGGVKDSSDTSASTSAQYVPTKAIKKEDHEEEEDNDDVGGIYLEVPPQQKKKIFAFARTRPSGGRLAKPSHYFLLD